MTPFAYLEFLMALGKQLGQESYMHLIVFNLSHLLLRLLLFPESDENYKVFSRLHTYQTSKLIRQCWGILEFEQWLCYIKAIEYDRNQ